MQRMTLETSCCILEIFLHSVPKKVLTFLISGFLGHYYTTIFVSLESKFMLKEVKIWTETSIKCPFYWELNKSIFQRSCNYWDPNWSIQFSVKRAFHWSFCSNIYLHKRESTLVPLGGLSSWVKIIVESAAVQCKKNRGDRVESDAI